MAKSSDSYICQSCGAAYRKWAGRCDACGEWNSIELEQNAAPPGGHSAKSAGRGTPLDLVSLEGDVTKEPRILTGNNEFDRAAGGGLVPGSALLIGGDPGVGKSTLLLQVASGILGMLGGLIGAVLGAMAVIWIWKQLRK